MKNPTLWAPFELASGVLVKNRFFKSAMSEALATQDNRPTQSLVTLYETWAKGGAGLLVTGNVMVDRRATAEPGNVVIEDERDLNLLKKWAKAGTQNETHLWMQLNHPGKQVPKTIVKKPVAPSEVPLSGTISSFFNKPRALTVPEIKNIIQRFGTAASVAEKAGFTGVQIHAAHGYLISQFLSPHHNRRLDEWGGSLSNRMRFLMDIYREIRRQTSDGFPVGIKLNSADFQRGGFTEKESIEVLQKLSEEGIDLIEISGGNYENPAMMGIGARKSTKEREAYFLKYADQAQKVVSAPLVVTGGFRSEQGMTEAISSEAINMVGLARPFALVPDLPNQIAARTYQTVETPPVNTGIKWLDQRAGSAIELSWYEQQLARIGRGQLPNSHFRIWPFLLHHFSRMSFARKS